MLTQDEVKHIALLARIGLKDEEVERYQHDLSTILDWFGELQTLDTTGVEPMGNITGKRDAARIDVAHPLSLDEASAILSNAPETKAGFFKVKSVF